MIKIGKNISSFSTYSCKPRTKKELKKIIDERISKEGPNCDLNDIDVSLIEDMSYLFYKLDFNGDISNWDVSNVKSMMGMFLYSPFNGDISKWNVSRVSKMSGMFLGSKFNNDISKWDTSSVINMTRMFESSKFNHDISKWVIRQDCVTFNMFDWCHIKEKHRPKPLQR